jgi:cytochrome b involved in lipid metabolism
MSKAKRPKYFTPNEVSNHNTAKDIWVSFLGKVFDLTPLIEEHSGKFLLK